MSLKLAAAVIAVGVVLTLGIASTRGVELIGTTDQVATVGGVATPCIRVHTTCPDPGGIPAACTLDAAGQTCKQCEMSVANWSDCGVFAMGGTSCTEVVEPTSPFCGRVKSGRKPNFGWCVAASCIATTPAVSCGNQIPVVTGTPCVQIAEDEPAVMD